MTIHTMDLLLLFKSSGEIKTREVSWALIAGWIVLLLFRHFVTLLQTAVKTAISKVHKLLHTSGVPTSLTLLFWQSLQSLQVGVLG